MPAYFSPRLRTTACCALSTSSMGMPDTAVLYRRVARLITALAPITKAMLAMAGYGWWLVMQRMPGIFKDDERRSDAQDLSEQNALAGQFVRR